MSLRALCGLVVIGVLCASRPALAHDLRPGVVSLVETSPGAFDLRIVAPVDSRGDDVPMSLELPPGCMQRDRHVRCTDGLAGTLAVRGMRGRAMRTIVRIERLGGAHAEWIASAAAPAIAIDAAPPRTWLPWIRIGVEHIVGGLDHLAFVIGLLLVLELAFDRRLLLAISAFTLAHSFTLALATLGVVHVPAAPVEACIAASVLLVAREATHREPTAIRRWPWLAAAIFGLVHGLGFAGALGRLGMSRTDVASHLVWFNVGVELGQLAVVSVVLLIARLPGLGRRVHIATAYALGAVAAFWLIARVVAG